MGLRDSSEGVLHHVKVLILSLFLLLLIPPVFLLFMCPLYLFRLITSTILKPLFRPDLSRLITTRSAIWTSDDIHTNPDCNLVIVGIFAGSFDLPALRTNITNSVLNAKRPNSPDQLMYPEIQQYYDQFLGFSFWKNEQDFKLEEHMRFYEPESGNGANYTVDDEELLRIRTKLDRRTWEEGKSPWVVYFIPNYIGNDIPGAGSDVKKCVILFCIHHGLADGYSMINVIMNHIGGGAMFDMADIQKPEFLKRSTLGLIYDSVTIPFKALFLTVSQFLRATDSNELRLPESKLVKKFQTHQMATIPIDYIKDIKDHYNVSFTAILVGALAGGLRKFMARNAIRIPRVMNFLVPFPIPFGHPEKLRNYYSFVFLKFPVGEVDPKSRVKAAERDIRELKKSFVTKLNFLGFPLIGALPNPLIKFIVKNRFSTGIFSNFPGPNKICEYEGLRALDIQFSGGLLPGNTGLVFTALSYGGYIRLNGGLSLSFCKSSSDVEEIFDYVAEEFELLREFEIDLTSPSSSDVNAKEQEVAISFE